MKKINFRVSEQKEGSVFDLIRTINSLYCRVNFDIQNGYINVENADDQALETIINLVGKYFNVINVEINNNTADTKSGNVQALENEYLEEKIDRFKKSALWAIEKKGANEKEIGYLLMNGILEISYKYNNNDIVSCNPGEIVDCNYGFHFNDDVSGGHVYAIVCNVATNGMIYLVPILNSSKYSETALYIGKGDTSSELISGNAFVDRGMYVIPNRIQSVVGKTSKQIFNKILEMIRKQFDFM